MRPAESGITATPPKRWLGSRGLAAFGTAALALYAADGVVSLADHLLRRTAESGVLAGPRNVLARLTVLVLVAAWVALAATPRLPKRAFAAPLLVTAWWSLGAPPLPLVMTSERAFDALGISCQLASAAVAFAFVRARYGRFRLDASRLVGPAFRLRSSIGFFALNALLLPLACAVSIVFGAAAELERVTNRFVTFHGEEIRIHERRYRRGDREVRLVGMMHLGEASSYRDLFRGFRGPSTVVLEEGVSDGDGRLHRPLSYATAAKVLGLSTQPEVKGVLDEEGAEDAESPDVRNADVDLRDFRPETITFLDAAGSVWSAPSTREAIATLREFAQRDDAGALLSAANEDILTLRNRHLLEAITNALGQYRCVIVPWGALHLAAIEAALKTQDFVVEETSSRTLLRYATVAQALRGALQEMRPEAPPAAPAA